VEDLPSVGEAAHAVIQEAKDSGVHVFGRGIEEGVAPVMVAGDETIAYEAYAQTRRFSDGLCVLELPLREAALELAAKIVAACRCAQELREFMYNPES